MTTETYSFTVMLNPGTKVPLFGEKRNTSTSYSNQWEEQKFNLAMLKDKNESHYFTRLT